ncbi:DNA polymerase III subunit delta [Neochlamydia sp. S13]|uniref:DNA polymerase III subunit delta n=1 Tax=Neochlamydia sp. S13 TaxID=1353976 RepID=UPI0005A6B1D6|nr:DNA polymerase III subunit delta [Neochlamydia sp. S13]BBI17142.1 Uncharacterized protein NCS13_1_0947 [Neochlamydia sp. S13]
MKYSHLKAFEKHLESAAPVHFAPVYTIICKDEFNRKIAYERLISHLLGEQISNPMALCIYSDEKVDISKVMAELHSLGSFVSKRVVVIHHAESLLKAATEKLLAYYENPNKNVYLVLTATSLNASTNFYKKSERVGIILEIAEEKPWEKEKSLKEWIDQTINHYGKQINPSASQALLKQMGTEQAIISQEIEKLVCYVGEKRQISLEDVDAVCIPVNTETIWQLGEALFRRDASTALRIAVALLQEGTPLLILLRQIRSQFQTDFQVCTILAQGGSGAEVSKQFGYMKGQILERHVQLARNYGMARFRRGMILIDEAETSAKNSSTDHSYLIERLIAKLII